MLTIRIVQSTYQIPIIKIGNTKYEFEKYVEGQRNALDEEGSHRSN